MSHLTYYPETGWTPLVESATREVFEVMLGAKLEPFQDDPALVTEMIAMVGLSGTVAGVVSFHCTARGARAMAAKMLGTAVQEEDDSARDAVGEICNMVAGSFKNKLGRVGDECKLSVPTIISGAECLMQPNPGGTHVQMPFTYEGSPIAVVLDLRH